MRLKSLQNRLIYITMLVVTGISILTISLVYFNDSAGMIIRRIGQEQVALDRNAELLGVMLRQGQTLDSVKEVAMAPWRDGTGDFFVTEKPASSPSISNDTIQLTASVAYANRSFTVGENLSKMEILRPLKQTFFNFISIAVGMLLAMFFAIRYTIKAVSGREIERQRQLAAELAVAQQVQSGMLPDTSSDRAPACVETGILFKSSKEVGGDFYSYMAVGTKLHFIIADVSGKGVPAALYMAIASKLYASMTSDDLRPAEIAIKLNEALCSHNPTSMFITAMICRFDMVTGELELCNAGHSAPLLVSAGGNVSQVEGDHNLPLGIMSGYEFEQYMARMEQGDHILLYTDGVTEAENKAGEQLGVKPLFAITSKHANESPQQVVDHVNQYIRDFTKGRERTDDITMLDIRYVKPPKSHVLHIRPELTELAKVFELATEANIPDTTRLALEEAVVNVINHAAASAIEITCQDMGEVQIINITDDGKPFNPVQYIPPETNDEELKVGGKGIMLMKSLMDKITYNRENKRNILTLTKQDTTRHNTNR